MSIGMYGDYFGKAKNSVKGKLINHESQIVRQTGLLLRDEKWGKNIDNPVNSLDFDFYAL
jgi:hypothetical protein